MLFVANSGAWLGLDLFGGPVWFGIIGARAACVLISEGIFSTCGCGRNVAVRRFFLSMERVYTTSHDGGKDSVIGWRFMKQPAKRVLGYACKSRPTISFTR
jgi:hypothetical protein